MVRLGVLCQNSGAYSFSAIRCRFFAYASSQSRESGLKMKKLVGLLLLWVGVASAASVGFGFGSAATYTTNWNRINTPAATTGSLIVESGSATPVTVTLGSAVVGNDQRLTETAPFIPSRSPAIIFPGSIYKFGDGATLTVTITGLTPGRPHRIWVFAFRYFGSMTQEVTITGAGAPEVFSQSGTTDQVFINDTLGSNASFSSFSPKTVTSDSAGQVVVQIQDNGAANIAVLSGLLIDDGSPTVTTTAPAPPPNHCPRFDEYFRSPEPIVAGNRHGHRGGESEWQLDGNYLYTVAFPNTKHRCLSGRCGRNG